MPTPIHWPLVPPAPPPDLVVPAPGVLTQITDLVARARNRVLIQYQGLTRRFLPLLDVLTGNVQELENAVWGFIVQFDLDNATDIWLDRLGDIVGEQREGENDGTYRSLIRARIAANKSSGTIEEILFVFHSVVNPFGMTLAVRDCSPASIEIIVNGFVFDVTNAAQMRLIRRLKRLLSITRAAGVRLMVVTYTIEPEKTFKFSDDPSLHGAGTARGFADANNLSADAGEMRSAFLG